jgi:hypothetical protein
MIINKAPPTEKQSAASRANGKKSRGPLTAEGKINSALNSTVHGLLARTIVLEGESHDRFKRLLDCLYEELRPESPIEVQLIETMAVARWRQMRIWGLEKVTIANQIAKSSLGGETGDHHLGDNPISRTAGACEILGNQSRWTEQMSRQEFRFDRQYNRAMTFFREHRAWRRQEIKGSSNEPVI